MRIHYLLVALTLASSLSSHPVVNRFMPYASDPFLPVLNRTPHATHARFSAIQVSKLFSPLGDEVSFNSRQDGLLELEGPYNLDPIMSSISEWNAAEGSTYTSPLEREVGASSLAGRPLVFGARSSLLVFGGDIMHESKINDVTRIGVNVPLIHAEARENYLFPVQSTDAAFSIPNREQIHRLRRSVHKDLNLKPGDWSASGVGDVSAWVQCEKTWKYAWLLRTASLSGRFAVSAPTGKYKDDSYAGSIPFGSDGHWGFSATVQGHAEVKESWHITLPLTLTLQSPHTRKRRLSMNTEPSLFSPLFADVRVAPGATFRFFPQITLAHLSPNIHVSLGWSFTKHWSDSIEDARGGDVSPHSYLSRTTLYNSTLAPKLQEDRIDAIKEAKKALTSWKSQHLVFDVSYVLKSLFEGADNPPIVRATLDYALSGKHVARSHRFSVGFSWRF